MAVVVGVMVSRLAIEFEPTSEGRHLQMGIPDEMLPLCGSVQESDSEKFSASSFRMGAGHWISCTG